MKIIKDTIDIFELGHMAKNMHGSLVKAIVDVDKKIMAVDASMHSDLFEFLIQEEDSEPRSLWGVNLYPEKSGDDFIEFDSMMNVRPALGNRTRGIESQALKNKIIEIVNKVVKR